MQTHNNLTWTMSETPSKICSNRIRNALIIPSNHCNVLQTDQHTDTLEQFTNNNSMQHVSTQCSGASNKSTHAKIAANINSDCPYAGVHVPLHMDSHCQRWLSLRRVFNEYAWACFLNVNHILDGIVQKNRVRTVTVNSDCPYAGVHVPLHMDSQKQK